MAQSDKRPTSGSRPAGGGSRRRTPPPPVKKPFPWGIVAISTVLGLLLLGILVYAVKNQGAGFTSALKKADKSVQDVKVYDGEARKHVEGAVSYKQSPPVGGEHNNAPQTCQVYTSPIASEHAVHSLEHGAVWITYKPDLPAADVLKLKTLAEGDQYRLLSPYPGLKSPISLQAWGRQIFVDSPTDKRVTEFLSAYTSGPQAPEQGAACSGTTETGPLAAQAPAPAASVAVGGPS
ncbi:MAG: DUF3105 domain-containing protein, partial [Actinobacteria bacterium]|nr:DUF3105 domain-containing protein [Actinomycetota bacterium]MCA1720272.1 DUF3105 domain-containing protein [Actinomycetota bacterium]